ncbi:MAG: hypothetical protein E6Q89_00315 [Bacteroidia bacterium]|nr:MAG: hypothetical protein E6Q89_00315 [Bacteroidia bacterium]
MIDIRIITELLDAPIAFNPAFAKITGNNLAAGMLLSQLFYWAKAMNFEEFYKVSDELRKECFLGRTEFENARKKVIETGIFSLVKKGVPCRSFYKINLEVLFESLRKLVCTKPVDQFVERQQSSLQETNKLDCMKPANKNVGNQQAIINNREYTETTSENINNNKNKTLILEIPPEPEITRTNCNNSGSKNNNLAFDYTDFDEPQKTAINSWFTYRKEAKKTYKTKSSLTALRNKMLELKASGLLIEAINHSIAMEYTGLFPPNNAGRYIPHSGSPPKKQFNYVHDFTTEKPGQQVETF